MCTVCSPVGTEVRRQCLWHPPAKRCSVAAGSDLHTPPALGRTLKIVLRARRLHFVLESIEAPLSVLQLWAESTRECGFRSPTARVRIPPRLLLRLLTLASVSPSVNRVQTWLHPSGGAWIRSCKCWNCHSAQSPAGIHSIVCIRYTH